MSQCQDHSCCSNKSGCQSSHGSCGQTSCGCQSKASACGCGCKHCGCDYASKFLELADCAWKEALKEKIKEYIHANSKHLDELARIIAEANHERWQKKMEDDTCGGGFEEKLNEFFGKACHTKSQQWK